MTFFDSNLHGRLSTEMQRDMLARAEQRRLARRARPSRDRHRADLLRRAGEWLSARLRIGLGPARLPVGRNRPC